jgi:hypothetical protein
MSVRRKSLMQMIKLGKTSYFDSYLLELDEYPYTSGSLLALSLLTDMQGLPEHVVDVLIGRWQYCDDVNHRLGLVRALVRTSYPSATNFLGEKLLNKNTDSEVVKFISEVLGNSGPESIDWFLKLWRQSQNLESAKLVFFALTRYSENPEVRELFVSTAQSTTIDPLARRFVLELLHKVSDWFSDYSFSFLKCMNVHTMTTATSTVCGVSSRTLPVVPSSVVIWNGACSSGRWAQRR